MQTTTDNNPRLSTMSSASSSTVTAYNARRHRDREVPTQSSHPHPHPTSHAPSISGSSSSYRPRSPRSVSGTTTPRPGAGFSGGGNGSGLDVNKRKTPITPAVLRDIFASSRTILEERTISRVAFFRCVALCFFAAGSERIGLKYAIVALRDSCSVVWGSAWLLHAAGQSAVV